MKLDKILECLDSPNVDYIYNGPISDPQIKYKDYIFNYYDLEERLFNRAINELGIELDNETYENWIIENQKEIIYQELEDLINVYWKEKLIESPFKELNDIKENEDLNIFNDSLQYQIQAVESIYDENFLDNFKLSELKFTSENERFEYLMKTCFDMAQNKQWLEEIKQFPENIKKEIEEFNKNEKEIENGKPIFTEKDIEQGVNVKLENENILSFWYSQERRWNLL